MKCKKENLKYEMIDYNGYTNDENQEYNEIWKCKICKKEIIIPLSVERHWEDMEEK
jgi:hypothetical protein